MKKISCLLISLAKRQGKTLNQILEDDPSKKHGKGSMGPYVVSLIFNELENP